MSYNKKLYAALDAFTGELADRGWNELRIQDLELDDLSILKSLELVLPKNVSLTIDYTIDETYDPGLREDTELADFIREEAAVIKENGAEQSEYSYLFGKCFIKDDGHTAVRIVGDCKRKDTGGCIEAIHNTNEPMPFVYEKLEYYARQNDEYDKGWNFGTTWAYEALFDEPSLPGVDVNVPVECEELFRLDAEGCLWTENEECVEWHYWAPLEPAKYDKLRADAERHLPRTLEYRARVKEEEEKKEENNDTEE